MIKGSIGHGDIKILTVYTPKQNLKIRKTKMDGAGKVIDKSTIIVGYFSTHHISAK